MPAPAVVPPLIPLSLIPELPLEPLPLLGWHPVNVNDPIAREAAAKSANDFCMTAPKKRL
jgi:hypothetical protein